MTRDPCKPVLSVLILCLLLELLSLQYTSGQSGALDLVPRCLRCTGPQGAQCIVDYVNQTVSCTVNTSECDVVPCGEGVCHFMFLNIGRWSFSSACFDYEEAGKEREEVLEDECSLRGTASDRVINTFPPPDGFFCQCNDYERCSFAEPFVYTNPYPPSPNKPDKPTSSTSAVSPSSSSLSSPSPSPSPSPFPSYSPSTSPSPPNPDPAGSTGLDTPFLAGIIVAVCLVVGLTVVAAIVFIILRSRKTRQHSRHAHQDTALPNLSDEQDLPFELGHLISRGRFGFVYRTQYEEELVAVKIFQYQNRVSWENERTLFTMQSTKHSNVIDYIVSGSWGSGYQLQMFIVTPFYPLGSLNRFLDRNTVSWAQACRVIVSVSNGLSHLHSEMYTNSGGVVVEKYAIAHRDVKSANTLVRGENGDCVISDLGFALILDTKEMANTGQVGTYRYMAPEVLDARVNLHNTQAFKQIDIYALALVMWEVVCRCNVQEEQNPREYLMAYEDTVGQRPGIDRMRDVVCTQKLRPHILPAWRNHQGLSALVDTIEECWDEDPEARLSAVNVVLRMKELLDGGPSPLAEDYAPSHTVAPDNDRYRRSDLQESTTDTIGTTDSRPPPYDSRWGYSTAAGRVEDGDGVSDTSSPSGSVGLNVNETTV